MGFIWNLGFKVFLEFRDSDFEFKKIPLKVGFFIIGNAVKRYTSSGGLGILSSLKLLNYNLLIIQ
jgi:hypothetical protein